MASDRVDKFWDDSLTVLSSKNNAKITSEISKLRTWLQKHQTETIPDGSKTKLLNIIEKYYLSMGLPGANESLSDLISGLIADLLALPEGKLVSAKGKSRLLKWLQSSTAIGSNDKQTANVSSAASGISYWIVADISDETGELTLMKTDVDSDEILENIKVDNAMLSEIKQRFDCEEYVSLEVNTEKSNVIRIME